MTTIPVSFASINRSRYESAFGPAAVRVFYDALIILLAWAFALLLRIVLADVAHLNNYLFRELPGTELAAGYLVLFTVIFLWVGYRYGLYSLKPASSSNEIRLIIQTCFTAGLALCGALSMVRGAQMPRAFIVVLVASSMLALSMQRFTGSLSSSHSEAARARTVAIVGTNQFSYVMSEHMRNHPRLSYNFLGFIGFPGCHQGVGVEDRAILGNTDNILELTQKHFIDEIFIAEYCPDTLVMNMIDAASDLNFGVNTVSGFYPHLTVNAPVDFLGDFPTISLHRTKSREIALAFKRCVDALFSAVGLTLAAIPMVLVALVIKLDSPGPVFYVSDRCGKRGRVFRCYKFRTMVVDAEARKAFLMGRNERDGIFFKLTHDPRVTCLGRFLRKYSIDELPQLFNVLRGEMSLVGPRPPIPIEVERYDLEHLHRLSVLPGITGLWQVKARMDNSFARYIALDISYVENWSPWLDMKIFWRTIAVVLRGTGS